MPNEWTIDPDTYTYWFNLNVINEIIEAVNTRLPNDGLPLFVEDRIVDKNTVASIQQAIYDIMPYYAKVNADGSMLALTSYPLNWNKNDFDLAMGGGFRRYSDKVPAQGGTCEYGLMQGGDYFGPWLFQDIKKALKLLWLLCYNYSLANTFYYGQSFGRVYNEADALTDATDNYSMQGGVSNSFAYSRHIAAWDANSNIAFFTVEFWRSGNGNVPKIVPLRLRSMVDVEFWAQGEADIFDDNGDVNIPNSLQMQFTDSNIIFNDVVDEEGAYSGSQTVGGGSVIPNDLGTGQLHWTIDPQNPPGDGQLLDAKTKGYSLIKQLTFVKLQDYHA